MLVFDSIAATAALQQPVHWAMGFFDGVHRGHRSIIQSADTPGALRGVLTFAQHPACVLAPERAPLLLTPHAEQKSALLREAGAEVLAVLPFTPELAATPALDFLRQLHAAAPMAGVSVGTNWRFGKDGGGNTDLLTDFARSCGLNACILPMQEYVGERISSTRIRRALAQGAVEEVTAMLGHPFSLYGTVEHGQKLARKLGFPTANVPLHPRAALPPYGVYAVQCRINGETVPGIANLGLRPTVTPGETAPRLEVHLPGWDGDLYGSPLQTELLHFLRPEQRFASLAELQAQIARDIACAADRGVKCVSGVEMA